MSELKPYPRYQSIGFEWLSVVPSHWEILKFRYVFRESQEVNGTQPVGEMLSISGYRGVEIKKYDDDNKRRTAEELENYRVVRSGQLAVNTMWLNYAGLGVSEFDGHVSPAYRSYWISENFDKRYLHHLTRCSTYVAGYTGLLTGIRPNSLQMSRSDLSEFPILKPPREEQVRIALYLDNASEVLGEFIADQEKLIELLKERRSATITQAVTKGLDPNVVMKKSGITWLGQVPEHWSVTRLNRAFEVVLGKMLDEGKKAASAAKELPYLRAANVQDGGLRLDDIKTMRFSKYEAGRLNLLAGDLLIVEGGSIGTCQVLESDMPEWSFQKTLNRLRPRGSDSTQFLAYLVRTLRDRGILDMVCNKSTIPHLTAEKLQDLPIPLPPVAEQAAITDHLDRETAEIDAAIADAQQAIALSKERRSALISAAVTGKIDVRDAVVRDRELAEAHAQ